MKTLKYELNELREIKQGLQFVHDYFLPYMVKSGVKKFDKMLKESDKKQAELLERHKAEYHIE